MDGFGQCASSATQFATQGADVVSGEAGHGGWLGYGLMKADKGTPSVDVVVDTCP